jgi:hypothetical protein
MENDVACQPLRPPSRFSKEYQVTDATFYSKPGNITMPFRRTQGKLEGLGKYLKARSVSADASAKMEWCSEM